MSADPNSPLSAAQHARGALDATVADPSSSGALDATVAASPDSSASLPRGDVLRSTVKSTVLPRFTADALVHEERPRYEVKRALGEGAMGEVALAIDNDIGRPVALKQLTHQGARDTSSLARFVEEIHTVGALEHPNIVPIHDVGVGDDGRYFFVMKHVEGETLESIIEKLAAGDAATHAKYTFTARVEIMIGLLRALDYAHAQGVIHRDIKPANVMVGPFGEVMLMDWGVAKAKRAVDRLRPEDPNPAIVADDARARLFTTRHGALVGTPAYMSPEQARGDNPSVDERSDLYSAGVLFHELVSLRHYMDDKTTLPELLRAIQEESRPLVSFSFNRHPAQSSPPAELLHFVKHTLEKDPAKRYQSAHQMITVLEDTLDGRVKIECPFTLTKRVTREISRFADRHPIVALAAFAATIALVLFSLVSSVRAAI